MTVFVRPGYRMTAIVIGLIWLASCSRHGSLPKVGSKEYRDLCASFYLGLAALESGEDVRARSGLTRATEIAPGEPAGWVDLGLLQARQQEFDAAYQSLEKARTLAPDNGGIQNLLGLVESRRGRIAEALAHYKKAVELDGTDLRARYALATETERQQNPTSDPDALRMLGEILKLHPQNEAVLLDVIRLAAKLRDTARLQQAVGSIARTEGWPEPALEQLQRLVKASKASDFRDAGIQVQFLRNTLVRNPGYRRSVDEVRAPATAIGEPFSRFLKLPSPTSEPALPDHQLQFEQRALPQAGASVTWIGSIPLDGEGISTMTWADSHGIHVDGGATLPLPAGRGHSRDGTLPIAAVVGVDLNYDFKTDLAIATADGVRIFQQDSPQRFEEITAKTRLPIEILRGAYTGAWATDFDLDGDLDLILGVPQGEPVVLRNNGDGTFAHLRPFKSVDGMVAFANADIDDDGVPDAALIDSKGKLLVFHNERLGAYRQRSVPAELPEGNLAVNAGDVNGDGRMDFVLLRNDYSVVRLSQTAGGGWDVGWIAPGQPAQTAVAPASLLMADLDNNGALDLIAAGRVFLSDGKNFTPLTAKLPADWTTLVDLNRDGRLDGIALSSGGTGLQLINRGSKNYNWQTIRTRAASVMGDQRINPFGIGGEIEIRAQLLTQKQIITSPVLHFGLGEHQGVEFARIVWPNGVIQTEFSLEANQAVLASQRLKGSCPFLFAWDGQRMRFLKDVAPMSAPLGAHLDGQRLEKIGQTQQWFKIDGRQLTPRDGYYDLRLTDEYWETYYIDYYSLFAVDHPQGSYVFVDERVADPPAALYIYATAEPHSFASAKDDSGRDVSGVVRTLDGKYLDGFGVGQYQGLTRDHWIELELPADAPRNGPLYLIGDGFLHPWDDTITMARSQGGSPAPQDLLIEVPDPAGGWAVAKNHLGIPAGRLKTVVIDLKGIFRIGAPRKLRLRTNMEVYWDKLAWAAGVADLPLRRQRLPLSRAELRYRGFSLLAQEGPASPELADYDTLASTGPQWRNLEGYHTRYGDVRELLKNIDDRFVIASSGDELRLLFTAAAAPDPGWVRDFIFIGDGWMKEGDYNFRFSQTVLPLPRHSMKTYTSPLAPLEKDHTYLLNPFDWQRFHTRYVTPERFARALWNRESRGRK